MSVSATGRSEQSCGPGGQDLEIQVHLGRAQAATNPLPVVFAFKAHPETVTSHPLCSHRGGPSSLPWVPAWDPRRLSISSVAPHAGSSPHTRWPRPVQRNVTSRSAWKDLPAESWLSARFSLRVKASVPAVSVSPAGGRVDPSPPRPSRPAPRCLCEPCWGVCSPLTPCPRCSPPVVLDFAGALWPRPLPLLLPLPGAPSPDLCWLVP